MHHHMETILFLLELHQYNLQPIPPHTIPIEILHFMVSQQIQLLLLLPLMIVDIHPSMVAHRQRQLLPPMLLQLHLHGHLQLWYVWWTIY